MYSTTEHEMVAMTWSAIFWREYVLNNFDVSRQLAKRREACLLRLLPCQRVRAGSQHEEKLLLTSRLPTYRTAPRWPIPLQTPREAVEPNKSNLLQFNPHVWIL